MRKKKRLPLKNAFAKNYRKILFLLVLFAPLFTGCKGTSGCLRVDYKDYGGEYCFSPSASEKENVPVFENEKGDTLFSFSEAQIKELSEIIGKDTMIKSGSPVSPCNNILKAIEEHKKKKMKDFLNTTKNQAKKDKE